MESVGQLVHLCVTVAYICNLTTSWRWVVIFTHWSLFPQGNNVL